jgi:hypothetical protein
MKIQVDLDDPYTAIADETCIQYTSVGQHPSIKTPKDLKLKPNIVGKKETHRRVFSFGAPYHQRQGSTEDLQLEPVIMPDVLIVENFEIVQDQKALT